jgi:hypothetical protein
MSGVDWMRLLISNKGTFELTIENSERQQFSETIKKRHSESGPSHFRTGCSHGKGC